jgi:hypothetical protein
MSFIETGKKFRNKFKKLNMSSNELRCFYIHSLMLLTNKNRDEEICQMIVDLMDVTNQTELGDKISKAFVVFEGDI